MRSAVMLVPLGVLLVGACSGGEEGASEMSVQSEQVEIRTSGVGAVTPGAERRSPLAKSWRGPRSGARDSALAGPSWTPTEAPIPRWR